ncbi:hypothetical protein BJ742DRAFT_374468 [Cladochytrium replicatum]|nr:hypothetical protein BJ742DRAFT_374468 [Cladochytrium replicatum]
MLFLSTTPAVLQVAVESAIISVATGSDSKLMDVRIDWLLPANGSNATYVADDSFGPGKRAPDGTPLPLSGFDRTKLSEIKDISVFGLCVLGMIGSFRYLRADCTAVSEANGLLLTLQRCRICFKYGVSSDFRCDHHITMRSPVTEQSYSSLCAHIVGNCIWQVLK